MKKLMIALAIVAAAVCTNAGTVTWKTAKTGGAVFGPDTGVAFTGGAAYLFLASQADDILAAFIDGAELSTLTSIDNNSVNSTGKIAVKSEGVAAPAGAIDAIFAVTTTIGDKDYLYISTIAHDEVPSGIGNAALQFAETAASKAAVMNANEGYNGAGWYAVPEPTSGLMMLLGMGVLALRRRRA